MTVCRLDRVITVGVQEQDGAEDGTPIPGPIVDHEVWAEKKTNRVFSTADRLAVELRDTTRWRIRWRADFWAAALDRRLSVLVAGVRYQTDRAVEVDRRRFLDLTVEGIV